MSEQSEQPQELITVNLDTAATQMHQSPAFQQILHDSPKLVSEARTLLAYDPATIDDNSDIDVNATIAEMNEIRRYESQIQNALKSVRGVFNDERDRQVNNIVNLLNEAHFNELEDLSDKIRIFKQDRLNSRKKRNWDAVKEVFDQLAENLPKEIFTALPTSVNFDNFRDLNKSLVNAQQTWRLNDKVKSVVSTYITTLNNDYTAILALHSNHQDELLKHYDLTGDLSETIALHSKLLEDDKKLEEKRHADAEKLAQRIINERKEKEHQQELAKQQAEQKAQVLPSEKPLADTNQTLAAQPFTAYVSPEEESKQTLLKLFPKVDPDAINQTCALNLINSITNSLFSKSDTNTRHILKDSQHTINLIQYILNQAK